MSFPCHIPARKIIAIFFAMAVFLFPQNDAQAAVSFIGTSNLIATNGSTPGAVTPNASTINGDLLVFYHYSAITGGDETITLPTGFTSVFNSATANQGLGAVGWRIKQAGDTTFTASVTNHSTGGTGETIVEWIETFRGTAETSAITDFTASLSTWASSLNVGPIAAPITATVTDGDMVVVFGGRRENITAQTVLSGDNLSWTAQTLNNTNSGADAGAITQTGLNTSGTNQTVTAKTITTTGTTQAGAGRMFIIKKVPDTTPPTPNPMTFVNLPVNDSATQISMTATTATDTSTPPVSYFFTLNNTNCGTNAGTGGTSSSWQTGTTYSDSGLTANKCYGYTVKARDSASTLNETTASGISSTYTSANTPGAPTLSSPTTNTLNLTNAENSNPASNPTTNFAVQIVTTSPSDAVWLNKWVDASGNPSATAVWLTDAQMDALTLHSLQSSTLYGVKVKARNQDTDETTLSAEGQGTTSAPVPITTLSNLVTAEPSDSTIAPGASALVDSFGLQTSSGSDTVTGATVTLATGIGSRIATVSITNNGDTVTYCSATPSGDTATMTGCGIPVSTTNTQFKIKITAITHTAMPSPPGASYAVTGTVTSFASTNTQSGTDASSATITIDNLSPANVTNASGSSGSSQVTLIWANPPDSDYATQIVLRRATSAVADVPEEGMTYSAGNTIGTATVACVIATPTETCIDTGLINGTAYHYKTFSKDSDGNYSIGIVPTGSPFTPSATTFTITSSAGSNGSIVPSGTTSVAQGSSQLYTLVPDSGYDVATLIVDSISIATSTTYTFTNVQAPHTISGTFSLLPVSYAIVATAGGGGTITPLGTTNVSAGASLTYTITPSSGYEINTLTVDSVSIATSTSYTFTNVQTSHTISVTFIALATGTGEGAPGTGASRPTTVTFLGKAFPKGTIQIIDRTLYDEKLFDQKNIIDADGSFRISFVGIFQTLHSFGLIIKDTLGRSSQTKFFTIDTRSDDFVIKDILVPPTIDIVQGQVSRGSNALIVGYASPEHIVQIKLDDIIQNKIIARKDGSYSFKLPTGELAFGQHKVQAIQIDPVSEKKSDLSLSRTFIVSRLSVVQADLSGDGKIDIRDWSIFLSRWISKNSLLRESIDLNEDGKTDIADFSIFIKTIRK